MKLINKIKDAYWKHKHIAPPLRGHKVTLELAEQLLWSLENDLKFYCRDKKIELEFRLDSHSYIIDVEAKEPGNIIDKKLESDELDGFDLEIVYIVYQDILWCILHYEIVLERAYDRIDKIYNILSLERINI